MSAAAAAEAARLRREEEESSHHVRFGPEWEFKILRSAMARFGRRDRLEAALREEGAAGWQLVEKLDNARIRLEAVS